MSAMNSYSSFKTQYKSLFLSDAFLNLLKQEKMLLPLNSHCPLYISNISLVTLRLDDLCICHWTRTSENWDCILFIFVSPGPRSGLGHKVGAK